MSSKKALEFAAANQGRFLDELKALLRIPSISTLPEHNADTRRAAEFCAAELRRIGMEHVELIETHSTSLRAGCGHPLVYADWLHAAGKPTVLCYGHYDVQPPDPLDEWISPPFEPTERDGNLYARGAVDDKGQMWTHIKALESLLAAGPLPINVRVILEGEEEVGGEGIAAFVREHPERLKADLALVSDTEMFEPGLPTLCTGLRGMIYVEIEARGAKTDLHSGMYGGAAPNPFIALAQVIGAMKDAEGKILIPGIYDAVEPPSEDELRAWRSLPFDEEEYRRTEVGSSQLTGEKNYSVMERTWARPSLDVHGMPGGFTGAGAKTVIPAKASAKLSIRTVPRMTSEGTFESLARFVRSHAPPGVEMSVRLLHAGEPIVIGTDNRYVQAATAALRQVFGRETVFIRSGGSIPIVGDFARHLNMPSVMMGFGLPDDNLHAPNEKFHIANLYRGIESIIRFMALLGS
ncbi:MAG TPA: dipeptidase [Acidobacteriaceae bacterium]|jgi:acetylornithine deacetylase/succinyl-diaminopimelate desuccinylase-like protein|nr:dipeptidase [Acidobacteriaceae bacterium]